MYRLCVGKHIRNGRLTTLLNAATGLVLEGRDTALLVSRRRIIIDHLVVTDEVILEAVQHMGGLLKDFLIYTPSHQHALRTEHLRHLGQNRGATLSDDHVGNTAHGRVCRNARKTIGATTLHAKHELIEAHGLAVELACIIGKLMKQPTALLKLILHILTGKELYTMLIIRPQLLEELLMRQILAAERKHQDGTGIWMTNEIGEQLSCRCMIMTGL